MFEKLENGRIWIYSSKRKLTADEQLQITLKINDFCNSWSAHGNQLSAQFQLLYNQILVLAVDENQAPATGCSIDEATGVFLEIDKRFGLDLINRLNLTFLMNEEVRIVKLADLNDAYVNGEINDETLFLDNTINTLAEFKTNWIKQFADSWAFKKVKPSVEEV